MPNRDRSMPRIIKAHRNDEVDPAAELLNRYEELARQGLSEPDIAREFGFRSVATLKNRLLKASQQSGRPVPAVRRRRGGRESPRVQVKRRGKGEAYGVAVPMAPLARAGIGRGDKLEVSVRPGRIVLRKVADEPGPGAA